MSRNSTAGRGSTGDSKDDVALSLYGVVVETDGVEVGIYNTWIHHEKKRDVVTWEKRDSYDKPLKPGNWVNMVWRREVVTKVTRWDGEPLMEVRQCRRTGEIMLLAELSLKSPDPGKHTKQMWHEEFQSIGLIPAYARDMTVGGAKKWMWIQWMSDRAERDNHLQGTGYDVVWKVAMDQGEQMYVNGRVELSTRVADSGVASQITTITSIQSSSNEEIEVLSKADRVRIKGSYPGKTFNRVGIITGHKKNTPFYYVWTPGAPPKMEGKIIVHRVNGEEQIQVCDWIHFRISRADEDRVFKNRDESERFEVVDWKPVDRYFPTQLSPNKLTIEIAISSMVMTPENTKMEECELFYEDDDFGWIGDRNQHFQNVFPIKKGTIIELEGVIRRVKPRFETDSAWMILSGRVKYKGLDDRKKKDDIPQERGECPSNGREINGRDDGENGHGSNGRDQKKGKRDHFLLQPPRVVGGVAGDVIQSTAIVEGIMGTRPDAFVWLIDAAASGVVNGGAKYLKLGDVIYGKFRLQDNGKWGSKGEVTSDNLPRDMSVHVRKEKVYVEAPIIYDAERDEFRNPWFETCFDMECKMPRDRVDREVYLVELTKVRNGFNIHKLLNY